MPQSFNSLPDSHCGIPLTEVQACKSFQFPTGFSRLYHNLLYVQHSNTFQFPTGFSPRHPFSTLHCKPHLLSIPYRILTGYLNVEWCKECTQLSIPYRILTGLVTLSILAPVNLFQFPTGFSPKKIAFSKACESLGFQFPTGFSHDHDKA